MKNRYMFFVLTVLFVVLCPVDSFADVFGALATKVNKVGSGFVKVGIVTTGLGLICFSFAAIFNKISWKTLGYIMLSAFILSSITAVINLAGSGGSGGSTNVSGNNNSGSSSASGGVPSGSK